MHQELVELIKVCAMDYECLHIRSKLYASDPQGWVDSEDIMKALVDWDEKCLDPNLTSLQKTAQEDYKKALNKINKLLTQLTLMGQLEKQKTWVAGQLRDLNSGAPIQDQNTQRQARMRNVYRVIGN